MNVYGFDGSFVGTCDEAPLDDPEARFWRIEVLPGGLTETFRLGSTTFIARDGGKTWRHSVHLQLDQAPDPLPGFIPARPVSELAD